MGLFLSALLPSWVEGRCSGTYLAPFSCKARMAFFQCYVEQLGFMQLGQGAVRWIVSAHT